MKFDFAIGNPPYQEEQKSEDIKDSLKNFAPPVYHHFIDAANSVASKVELIHPARFLFNAGSTPKYWNEKMLNDEHFTVLDYEKDSSKVFSNTDIKGGIAITYHDNDKNFGCIRTFTAYPEVNSILRKVTSNPSYESIDPIVFSRTSYRLTEKLHVDFPDAKKYLSEGHLYDVSSNIFQRLPFVFYEKKPTGKQEVFIKIIGRDGNKRVIKYINDKYINEGKNLDNYKVYIPQASGSGQFGEALGLTIVAEPGIAATETFLSIGKFETKIEAENTERYIKTKFFRCLLSVMKVTQIANKPAYKYVPLQDFTTSSDIDWSVSIPNIDKQLYKKYNLSQEEINFIETNVKEME